MIALPALSGLYVFYAPYAVKENPGSGRLAARTGALIVGYHNFLSYSSFRLLQIDN